MAEVVEEINRAFETDPDIDELGMVLSADENIVLVEHKLGISMAILKPLFKYSVTELQKNRSVLLKSADLIDSVEAQLICDLSRAILLVKGDFPPALNARKIMIVNGTLSARGEVQFLNVIFSKHPKSPSAWHHRRWCLLRLFAGHTDGTCDQESGDNDEREQGQGCSFSAVVDQEVALCERMCDLYPRNYYAWNHRLWLAQHMDDVQQLELEYDQISIWLKRHVSDHSAINHQHQVVLLLIKVAAVTLPDPGLYTRRMLEKILSESMQVLHSGGAGGHASLWGLRRLWVQTLLSVLFQHQHQQGSSGREALLKGEEVTACMSRSMHGFDVCFGTQTSKKDSETDTKSLKAHSGTVTESETVRYLATVQQKVLSHIVDRFDEVKQTSEEDDTYIGLSLPLRGSGGVAFSPIEVSLDLPRLLEDGVTYAVRQPRGGGGGGVEDNARGDNSADDSREEEENGGDDEVTASLHMHCSRLSVLLQQLPVSQHGDELVVWLFRFITEELLFCGTCITTSGWYTSNCWDPKKQKMCALEYSIFLIYQVLHFLKSNGLEVEISSEGENSLPTSSSALMTENLVALARLSCQRYYEEGLGLCAGKMQTVLKSYLPTATALPVMENIMATS